MLRIEELSRQHQRDDFDCGKLALNDYLAKIAFQHSQKGLSKTFVAVDEDSPNIIIGFFTITSGEVSRDVLPKDEAKKLPNHPLPIIKLARLAVNKTHQGQGIGKALFFEALTRAYLGYQVVGGVALFVDAKDEEAALFYRKFGFIPLPSYPLRLFMPFNGLVRIL